MREHSNASLSWGKVVLAVSVLPAIIGLLLARRATTRIFGQFCFIVNKETEKWQ